MTNADKTQAKADKRAAALRDNLKKRKAKGKAVQSSTKNTKEQE